MVVGYTALVVARDVAEAYIFSKFPDVLKNWAARKSMSGRAVYNVSDGIDLIFTNGLLAYMTYKIIRLFVKRCGIDLGLGPVSRLEM